MNLFRWLGKKQKEEDKYERREPRGPEEQRQQLIEEGYLSPDPALPVKEAWDKWDGKETSSLATLGHQHLPGLEDIKVLPSSPGLIKENSSKVTHKDIGKAIGPNQVDLFPDGSEEERPKIAFKAILSNKTLTVFLPGGDIITNTGATKELFLKVREASSEGEIRELMLSPDEISKEEQKRLQDQAYSEDIQEALPEIVATGDFIEKKGSLYLKGIEVSIPKVLAREFLASATRDTSEYYESLKRFWCWCVLNPDGVAREDLFGFLERGDFKITKNGFFLGYRNVVTVKDKHSSSQALTKFVTDKYLNIKTKQKKSPKNFTVVMDNMIPTLIKNENVPVGATTLGNLADLYNQLGDLEDNNFTDAYTRTMKIQLGIAVKMERDKCDHDPESDCSQGLHIGNKAFGYQGGNGDTTILVAVNPMNVVAVPNHNANKMRVCEYMPLGVVDNAANYLEDADTLSLEEEYASEEVNGILELAKAKGVKELAAKKVLGGAALVSQVALKLEDLQTILSQRVKQV